MRSLHRRQLWPSRCLIWATVLWILLSFPFHGWAPTSVYLSINISHSISLWLLLILNCMSRFFLSELFFDAKILEEQEKIYRCRLRNFVSQYDAATALSMDRIRWSSLTQIHVQSYVPASMHFIIAEEIKLMKNKRVGLYFLRTNFMWLFEYYKRVCSFNGRILM